MSVIVLDGEPAGAPARSRREAPEPQAGRQWQRQLETELAKHSVCKAIRLGDEIDASPELAAEGRPGSLPNEDEPLPWVAPRDAEPAPKGLRAVGAGRPVAMSSFGLNTVAKARPEGEQGAPVAPAEDGGDGAEAPLAKGAALEAETAATLRAWLKPCKITVFADQGTVRVWVRDARLEAGEAEALGQRLARQLRDKGGRLAMLAVNGAVVFQENAAGGLPILKQG
ncbi:hypothetical protein [Chromobacterium haemolyticum]|uniref:Uncharacterized protein n=1 Tax=Chromobacterium haemolyticum TaxID=394935 RepID=A0A1W0D182_9NEIS|nr:hypothetical protein [Chromobacterium haemolyticum]OQS40698.1 hypothetical protein B0T45_09900 [Chromobacterium haemolyticum]